MHISRFHIACYKSLRDFEEVGLSPGFNVIVGRTTRATPTEPVVRRK